jgi:hypothetical protein
MVSGAGGPCRLPSHFKSFKGHPIASPGIEGAYVQTRSATHLKQIEKKVQQKPELSFR